MTGRRSVWVLVGVLTAGSASAAQTYRCDLIGGGVIYSEIPCGPVPVATPVPARKGETYQCIGAQGNVTYTQTTPCAGGTRDARLPPPPAPPTTTLHAPGRGKGKVDIYRGMPSPDVWEALGLPNATNTTTIGGSTSQQWEYRCGGGTVYIYMRNDKVDGWQEFRGH